jgi:hypothetical protein
MRNYESRIVRLEQAITPEAVVVHIRHFGGGELRGLNCNHLSMPYFERKPSESEEGMHDRAAAQAGKRAGVFVLREDRSQFPGANPTSTHAKT